MLAELHKIDLPLKHQAKLQQMILYHFYFYLSKKIRLMFHVNPLPSTGLT